MDRLAVSPVRHLTSELKPVRVRLVDDFTIQVELADQDTVCFDCPPSRKDIRKLAKDGVTETVTDMLAVRYGVSEEAMRIRLINLLR